MKRLNRRDTLKLGGVAIAALAAGPAFARKEADALIAEFTRGKKPETAGFVLDIPLSAENASAVPVTLKLERNFSAASYCEEMLLIAEKNPHPTVCRFRFTKNMGMANVTSRIRLAESQTVVALARMSDGTVLVDRKAITVTIGGCNG